MNKIAMGRNPIYTRRHRRRRFFRDSVGVRMAQESLSELFYAQTTIKDLRQALEEVCNNDAYWSGLEEVNKVANITKKIYRKGIMKGKKGK